VPGEDKRKEGESKSSIREIISLPAPREFARKEKRQHSLTNCEEKAKAVFIDSQ